MEPRCFIMFYYSPAFFIVRTEPQSEIGRNRGKKVIVAMDDHIGAIEFGRALSERSWFSPRLKKSLDHNVRPAPPARVARRFLPQPTRVFKAPSTPAPIVVSL